MSSEELSEFELVEMNQPHNLALHLVNSLSVYRATLHQLEFSGKEKGAGLSNLIKILLVEIWQLLLAQD